MVPKNIDKTIIASELVSVSVCDIIIIQWNYLVIEACSFASHTDK